MKATNHASVRCQQRGIPPLVIDLLFKFGCHEHDHSGAEIFYFDQRSRKRIERYVGGIIGKLSEHLDSYAVVASGEIVTVGARFKRINHN